MEALAQKTLAQIVTDNYKAAEVLEKYDLDFCCKGKVSLEKACIDNNLSLSGILRELNVLYSSHTDVMARFSNWPLNFMVDYIITNHHDFVKAACERLAFYIQKIVNEHGSRHPELIEIEGLFDALAEQMANHMAKEELILFPYIKKLAKANKFSLMLDTPNFGGIEYSISLMESEHEDVGNIMALIRKLSNNFTPPEDACNTFIIAYQELAEFERDLHQHVHLENNILFPKAESLEAILLNA